MADGLISKKTVDAFACEPGKPASFFWDVKTQGFGLKAYPTGKKTFVVQFRRNGAEKRMTIGVYGILTPEQAREEAKRLLSNVTLGVDPHAVKAALKATPTVAEAANNFLEKSAKIDCAEATYASYETAVRLHILPAIGAMKVSDVKFEQCNNLHIAMQTKKVMANKVMTTIARIWNWHHEVAEPDDNTFASCPAAKVKLFKTESRENFLSLEQIAHLGAVLRKAETEGLPFQFDETKETSKHTNRGRVVIVCPFAIAAIRICLLTGCRRNEIVKAKWQWIDFDNQVLNLPKSKTGKKKIYLPDAAIDVLENLPRVRGNGYIIAGQLANKPRSDLKRPWLTIIRAAGLDIRLHDLRHSFASVGVSEALGLATVGKVLGHTQLRTTEKYAHFEDSQVRQASSHIGNLIDSLMKEGAPERDARGRRRKAA